MNVCIIPARGGSKRIPKKNIKEFCGRPIIAYSIEAALQSGCFTNVVVSTDDREIAAVAGELGAEVPFLRPAAISGDHAPSNEVIAHAVAWWEENVGPLGNVCCLYATSPLISPLTLQQGAALLAEGDCDFVVSGTSFEFPIQRAVMLDDRGFVSPFDAKSISMRSQDLEPMYHDAGQFYWARASAFARHNNVFQARSKMMILPPDMVQDIDTLDDWERAEFLYLYRRERAREY